ncbi:STOREKEEPER protein-like [Durio zibethinus]|uniref:STOREKEEPER protein-like n=1 Tax=Durio zibethinus TaxID=66656 RepID=A0A6P5Z7S3_DURZI|nr:STOREKEEPER protein-like [Durio zibethinus]
MTKKMKMKRQGTWTKPLWKNKILILIATESGSKQKKPPSSASNGAGGKVKTPETSRLWSEADEVAILEGIIEYKSKKGSDPYADSSGFHDYIKQSIQAEVTKNQLTEKIRRLKKKYKINAEKGRNGNDPVLSKPHDHKSFELSKKIWCNETNDKSNKGQKKMKTLGIEDEDLTEVNGEVTMGLPCFIKEKEVNADVSTEVCSGSKEDTVDFWKVYPCLKGSFETEGWEHAGGFLKKLVEKNGEIGRDKLNKMERAWRELRREDLELYLKRLELVQEVAQAALNAIKGFEI